MQGNPVREKLRRGETALGIMAFEFFSPGLPQVFAAPGPPFVLFPLDPSWTAIGIDIADAILAVPGIDVGWLGHFDLSNTMGITGQFDHPDFSRAVDRLLAACARHGKVPGFLAGSVPMAEAWLRRGIRCLCYGTDVMVLQEALATALSALRRPG